MSEVKVEEKIYGYRSINSPKDSLSLLQSKEKAVKAAKEMAIRNTGIEYFVFEAVPIKKLLVKPDVEETDLQERNPDIGKTISENKKTSEEENNCSYQQLYDSPVIRGQGSGICPHIFISRTNFSTGIPAEACIICGKVKGYYD